MVGPLPIDPHGSWANEKTMPAQVYPKQASVFLKFMSIRFVVQIFNTSRFFDTWILRFLYVYFTEFRYTQSLLSVVVADDLIPN